jgi:hypothetical protein
MNRQFHAPASLPTGKEPLVYVGKRLGGPQSRPGRYGEQKILDPTGTRTSRLVVQPLGSCYTD